MIGVSAFAAPNGALTRRAVDVHRLKTAVPPHERTTEAAVSVTVVASTPRSPITGRRRRLLGGLATAFALSRPQQSNAAIGFLTADQDRRQLELCLVAVLRVMYWAQLQANALLPDDTNKTADERKKKYLEARLGAKAILTGKVGGGATGKVCTLATLQVPACLADLEWHANKQSSQFQSVSDLRRDFSEGLAAIVEFDGLETLIDPSPRSSLTLSQYNDNKAVFVRRALLELVLPAGNKLVRAFGPEPLQRSVNYIQQYYSSEIPVTTVVPVVVAVVDNNNRESPP